MFNFIVSGSSDNPELAIVITFSLFLILSIFPYYLLNNNSILITTNTIINTYYFSLIIFIYIYVCIITLLVRRVVEQSKEDL